MSSTDASDGSTSDTFKFPLSAANFMNGTAIPNGSYKCKLTRHCRRARADHTVLLRALKVTGDATKQEDYESCE
jgi:hypothetical protein